MADYDDMNTPLTKEEQAFVSRKANELSYLFDGPKQPQREWHWYDALGEGFSSLIHRFDTSNMENERLQSLVGLSDEQFIDAVQSGRVNRDEWALGQMPRERRDALLQGRIAQRQNYQDMINQTAGYFKPTPHAQPDGILENIAYHGLASIPNVLAGLGELAAIGPAGMIAANTLEGNKNANEQVYSILRSQGQPIDIARQEAIGPFDQLADLGLRGATNLAVMNALGNIGNINPQWSPGSMSPLAQTAGNILTAGAVAGAGTEATQALTNYRGGIDNDLSDLTKQGLIAGATTAGIGTLSALRHGRKLWEAQKQYNATKPIDIQGRWINSENTNTNNDPRMLLAGEEAVPPESIPPTPENPNPTAPTENIQPPATWESVMNKYGFPTNSTYRDILSYIQHGRISPQDAAAMLGELRMPPQAAQDAINQARQARIDDLRERFNFQVHRMDQIDKPNVHSFNLPQSERSQVNVQQMPVTRPDVTVHDGFTAPQVTVGMPNLTPQVIPQINNGLTIPNMNTQGSPIMMPEIHSNRLDNSNQILQAPDYGKTAELEYDDWEKDIVSEIKVDHMGTPYNVNVLVGEPIDDFKHRAWGHPLEFVDDDGKTIARFFPSLRKLEIASEFEKVGWVRSFIHNLPEDLDRQMHYAGMLDRYADINPEVFKEQDYGTKLAQILQQPNNHNDEEDDEDLDNYSGANQSPEEAAKELANMFIRSVNTKALKGLSTPQKKTEQTIQPEQPKTPQVTPTPAPAPTKTTKRKKQPKQAAEPKITVFANDTTYKVYPEENGVSRVAQVLEGGGEMFDLYFKDGKLWHYTLGGGYNHELNEQEQNLERTILSKLNESAKPTPRVTPVPEEKKTAIPEQKKKQTKPSKVGEISIQHNGQDYNLDVVADNQLRNSNGRVLTVFPKGKRSINERLIDYLPYIDDVDHISGLDLVPGVADKIKQALRDKMPEILNNAGWLDSNGELIPDGFEEIRKINGSSQWRPTAQQPEPAQSAPRVTPTPEPAQKPEAAKTVPQVTPAPEEKKAPAPAQEKQETTTTGGLSKEITVAANYKTYIVKPDENGESEVVERVGSAQIERGYVFKEGKLWKKYFGGGQTIYSDKLNEQEQYLEQQILFMASMLGAMKTGNFWTTETGAIDPNAATRGTRKIEFNTKPETKPEPEKPKETKAQQTDTQGKRIIDRWKLSIDDKTFKVILSSKGNTGNSFHVFQGDTLLAEYQPYVDSYFDTLEGTGYGPDITLAVFEHLPQWLDEAGLLDDKGNLLPDGKEKMRQEYGYHSTDIWTPRKNIARITAAKKFLEQRETEYEQRRLDDEKHRNEREASTKEGKSQQTNSEAQTWKPASIPSGLYWGFNPDKGGKKVGEIIINYKGNILIFDVLAFNQFPGYPKYSGRYLRAYNHRQRTDSLIEYFPYIDALSITDIEPDPETFTRLLKQALHDKLPELLRRAGWLRSNGELVPDGYENERKEKGYSPWTPDKTATTKSAPKQTTAQTETKTKQPQQTAATDKGFNLAPYQQIAQEVKQLVTSGQPLTNKQLWDTAAKAFGGTLGEGKFTEKDAYDAMEMGVNLAILDMKYSPNQPNDSNIAGSFISDIDDLRDSILSKLPTQTNRTEDQNAFQQFSTPPHLAYLVNWFANIHEGDRVLEPSAGLGGLAVFAKNAGATLVLNELDTNRRNPLLKSMNLGETLHENAENIGDILIGRGYPLFDKIIMNPPFSSAGDRGIKSSMIGIQHLDSALQLLKPNGRLVIILGENMTDDHKAWKHIKAKFNVRANITINGRNYSQYGTSYGNSVIVIDNTGPTPPNSTVTGSFEDIKKIADVEAITHVRDDVPVTDKSESKSPEKIAQPAQTEQKASTKTMEPETKPEAPAKTESKPVSDVQEANNTEQSREELLREVVSYVAKKMKELRPSIYKGWDTLSEFQEKKHINAVLSGFFQNSQDKDVRKIYPTITLGDMSKLVDQIYSMLDVQEPKTEAAKRKEKTTTTTPKEDNMSKRSIDKIRAESAPVKISKRSDTERAKRQSEARKYYEALFGKQDDETLFEPYVPSKLQIENSKPHPADLVESAAMSAIKMPDITYSPVLPREIIEQGLVSEEQLETVTYAGQAHQKFLPTGERQGFLIGDGTGVGKGTEILSIIMDNFAQGHGNGKAVWLSVNNELSEAAKGDWKRLGNNPDNIFTHSSKTEDIPADRKGILFMGYMTLITRRDPKGGDNTYVHIEQIKNWLGEDFDGVIVLDECHKIRNAITREGSRGSVEPAKSARAAQELLREFPNARVVYASATNATDASHFCMFGRLGLWGPGTAFSTDSEFVLTMDKSGVSALEIIARTLKARGLFVSRSISFRAGPNGNNENVNFSVLEHKLTPVQKKIYDTVARALRITEQNIQAAVEACGGGVDTSSKESKEQGSAASQYWSLHQRICLQLITAFKTDTIIKDIQAALDRGESVLVNLSNTGDANFKRALQKNQNNPKNTLDDLDISLIDPLIAMIQKSFPIYAVEPYKKSKDEVGYRNVTDSEGNPVISQKALALREETIAQLNMVRGEIPAGLIDAITMHFGTDMVAECTSRTNRLVKGKDGKRELIGGPNKLREADSFNNGKKRILIFSEAGSTGVSYHASRTFKNQQKRRLLVAEPGWSSFTFVQSLGRVHRSNQAHKPDIVLVSTDLPGELRIRSTVTRRMLQLGASSTGERKANSQGLLTDRDNLESNEANIAMHRLFTGILKGQYPDMPPSEVLEQMGYEKEDFKGKFPQTTQILNRLMAMDVDYQNRFFKYFDVLRDEVIDEAIKNHKYDQGLSTIKAKSITVINEEIIKTDKETGIDTKYVQLEVQRGRKRRTFDDAIDGQYYSFFMTSEGQIVAARKLGERDSEGNLIQPRTEYFFANGESEGVSYQMYALVSPDFNYKREISQRLLENKSDRQEITFTPVDRKDARKIWDEQYEQLTSYKIENMHLITGDLLALWHTLTGYTSNIERVVANDGREFLGISIRGENIQNVLDRFNIHYNGIGKDFNSLMQELNKQGQSLLLNNGLSVKYSRVNGEKVIEIYPKQYFTYSDVENFKAKGFLTRIINYQTRVFVPIGKEDLLEEYIKEHPVQEIKKRDVLAETTEEINADIPDTSLDNLHFIHPAFAGSIDPDENPYVQSSNYAFNEKSEKRYQESKHIKRPTLWHRVADAGRQIWHGFSDVPELSGDDKLIPAHELVRELNRELRASTQETERRLRAALKDLNPDDYDLFGRAMALLDLKETIELDSKAALPWDYSPDSLNADYENIMKYVNQNQKVADAIEKAELLNKEITAALIKAADKLQLFDLRDRLKRQHYFRHIVLEYYHQSGGATPRPTMKNPQRRGYLKHREGSEKDIASDWILAMAEVWLRMNNDIKIIDTLVKIRKKYDIIEDLKQKAFALNYQKALHKIIADLPSELDDKDIDFTDAGLYNRAKEKLDKSLNHRQAQSVERLFKMAQDGDLPAGDNNQWLEFLGRFADAGQLEKLDSKTREELPRYIGWLASLERQPKETKQIIRARSTAQRFIRGDISKKKGLQDILKDDYIKWQDFIPEDHTIWSPSDSRIIFSAHTVTENAILMAEENIDELLGLPISELGSVLASGADKQFWCIPQKLADALNNIGKKQPQGMFANFLRESNNWFQGYILTTPTKGRVFMYNWRNFFGDLEAVLQGNPEALKYTYSSARELTQYMLRGGEPTGMLAEFVKRGGALTTEFSNELENWQELDNFAHLFEPEKTLNPIKLTMRFFKGYMAIARKLTNFRESILRYAAFQAYYHQIINNEGNAPFIGMSKPKEVNAVKDNVYDMAFKLANENLGAYDQVSQNVRWLRNNGLMSFISWIEVNAKRSIQMYKNIWTGNSYLEYYIRKHGQRFIRAFAGGGGGGGKPPINSNSSGTGDFDGDNNNGRNWIVRQLKKSPSFIMRFAITLALAAPMMLLCGLFNYIRGYKSKDVPGQSLFNTLILGTNGYNGKILSMNRLSAAADFFEFTGVDNIPKDVKDLWDGKTTLGAVVSNIVSGPVNRLISNVNPFIKAVIEMTTGRRLFPDFRNPSKIRSIPRYIAQSLALDWYFDALTGKAHEPFTDFASSLFNSTNIKAASYWYILSKKEQFEETKLGRHYDGFYQTEKSEALRQAKRAAELGDRDTMRKFLNKYRKAQGTTQGLEQSIRTMHPLFGLSEREQRQFRRWLSPDDNEILAKAMEYYRQTSRTLHRR